MKLVTRLVIVSSFILGTSAFAQTVPVNCSIYVLNTEGSEVLAQLPFTLPAPTQSQGPVTLLSSAEHDITVSYGEGISTDFATNGHADADVVPVHYLTVNPISHLSRVNGGLFVIDRVIGDFRFGVGYNAPSSLGEDYRNLSVVCETHPREVLAPILGPDPFAQLVCQYSRLDYGDQVLTSVEADTKALGQHGPIYKDFFYGFALSSRGRLLTELSNTQYFNALNSSAEAPQGLGFFRHVSSIPANAVSVPQTPEMRLSTQCQRFSGRTPVETKRIDRDVTVEGARTELFDIAKIEGRQVNRLQVYVRNATWERIEKLAPRIVLPSGRALHYEVVGGFSYLAMEDLSESELNGPLRIELQACDPSVTGDTCVPVSDHTVDVGIELQVFYK